ncbi:ABC transporter substrate-binding protein [Devosia geojensis]|uniref:ABC transporter substrate-binding protein n=2 Tax=Devosia geojensis TaxID=443610 RepID=A0A0F5FX69_9HYPH|nr:ABC transporter substrate-binding protein [Devosia geojensis]
MAIELWQALAIRAGLATRFVEYPTLRELVDATANGQIDVAVTNLTINQERAQSIDFTQPWYDAGLRIMVADGQGAGFWDVVAGLQESGHLRAYLWLGLVIVAATIALTLFDRRFDKEFPRDWPSGLAESFHHVMSIATSGKTARKKMFGAFGRFLSAVWLVCGVAVLAYVTSSVTSVMTAAAITSRIDGLSDLPGKTIGVFSGSVAETYSASIGLDTRSYRGIEDAVAALRAGNVQAVVADAPVLEYYSHTRGGTGLTVVGPIFNPDKYGFATPLDSPLSREITLDLLGAHEDGTVERLRTKYFGNER